MKQKVFFFYLAIRAKKLEDVFIFSTFVYLSSRFLPLAFIPIPSISTFNVSEFPIGVKESRNFQKLLSESG